MKTKIYSLRMSNAVRADLERVARRRKLKVSQVIHTAIHEWLEQNLRNGTDGREQHRLHAIANRLVGSFSSGNRHGSTRVRETVRARLAQKYGR